MVVPELGESVVEARVARWLKKEGDQVALGEALVELETEKIDLEVSADRAGLLTSIAHGEGADVKVGEVLAVLDPTKAAPAAAAPAPATAAPPAPAGSAATRATPAARNVAKEHAVSLAAVPAAGPRVTKQDVRQFVAAASAPASAPALAAAAPPGPAPTPTVPGERVEERVRMTKRRATIARRLVEAQRTAAMLTTFNEVDMSAVMALRERRKEQFQKLHGAGLGIASFFVKAAVGALKAFPGLNAEIQGDEIVYKRYYDIGVAVGVEGGLVVPVLRDADRMSFPGVELGIRDFAARATNGSLTLEDLKGGTFTITNGGVFGSLMSTPILNPPQVGILGLHKIADRAVPVKGEIVIRPMMYLALSYDHRLVDGREAVQFLVTIKDFIEDPAWLLVEG
ncbi:MAG: 2-oxoglutarate dehydrogenase complex dihydrolipoyllysine-residue succinyltransferase [Acidobacteria bacterium]|nr:2-oxoglutarate dehydrogenase complex dihydrolipoyllysine-residue succinyltransferase [Acidobacteriota bacterium]